MLTCTSFPCDPFQSVARCLLKKQPTPTWITSHGYKSLLQNIKQYICNCSYLFGGFQNDGAQQNTHILPGICLCEEGGKAVQPAALHSLKCWGEMQTGWGWADLIPYDCTTCSQLDLVKITTLFFLFSTLYRPEASCNRPVSGHFHMYHVMAWNGSLGVDWCNTRQNQGKYSYNLTNLCLITNCNKGFLFWISFYRIFFSSLIVVD